VKEHHRSVRHSIRWFHNDRFHPAAAGINDVRRLAIRSAKRKQQPAATKQHACDRANRLS
jgi:hypothetical protein